jgi:hypothetical protein
MSCTQPKSTIDGRVRRRRLDALAARLLVVGLALSGSSLAQQTPAPPATAKALFDEGLTLVSQGRYDAGCQRLEQSRALDPDVETLLYLGDCYERAGRLASAVSMYRATQAAAQAAGKAERARLAYDRAHRLTPSLPTLALMVAAQNRVAGFELFINGQALSPTLYGVVFPMDPGRYQLIARAPGRLPWSAEIVIERRPGQHVVQIPALAEGQAPGAPGASPAEPAAELEPSTSPTAPQVFGLVVASGGVLAVTAGVVFSLGAEKDDPDERCSATCVARQAIDADSRSAARYATISYASGIGAIALGALLYFVGEPSSASSPSVGLRVAPQVGKGGGGLRVSGAF